MKHRISYILIKALLFIRGRFPLLSIRVLPGIAHFLLKVVFKYRKKVIQENIERCFGTEQVEKISNAYYRHLSRVLIEPFFTTKLSEKYMKSRVMGDYSIFAELAKENKHVIALLGHMGNWEWLSSISAAYVQDYQIVCIYKKMSNPYIEKFINQGREKFGSICVEMKFLPRFLVKAKDLKKPMVLCFIADQIPSHDNVAVADFFREPMYFFNGYERIARKLNASIVYLNSELDKNKYIYNVQLVYKDVSALKSDEVVSKYVQLLEENIRNTPHNWLWSHRRWKRLPK